MAIFDNNFLFESSTAATEEFTVEADMSVEATMESVVEMNAELNESVYKLNTTLYIADLVMEQSGQTSLMEASLNDYWTKTKARFKEIWEKIRGFFKNLLMKMQAMFEGTEAFIKKYEKVIRSLTGKQGVVYSTFSESETTNHLDPAEMTKLLGKDAVSAGFAGKVADLNATAKAIDGIVRGAIVTKESKKGNDDLKQEIKKAEQAIYQDISKASDAGACKKEFRNMLRQKSTHSKNIMDAKMIIDMLEYCKKWIGDGKKNVVRAQNGMDKALQETMKLIDSLKLSQEQAAKKNESLMGLITEGINAMNRIIGVANYMNGISFDTFNGCFRTYVGMLKGFVSKNSKLVKASMVKKESATDSILDSIMANF